MIRRVLKNLRIRKQVECLGRGQDARWRKTDKWELGNELGNGELKELTVDTYIRIGKTVLSSLYRHYNKVKLDDAEYIPVVRVIIEGIAKALTEAGVDKKEVKAAEETLKKYNRDLYLKGWLKNAREDLDESEFDMEQETEEGSYYFDYIYKHGEHPR